MSTSPSSLSSLVAPPAFTGVSKFASSLQQVLSRAVGIASLPLDSLQAGLTDIDNRQSAVQGLAPVFTSLQQSVTAIQSAVSSGLLTSSLSNAGIVTASVGANAGAGTYNIEVSDLGAYSTALSVAGSTAITDPSSSGIGAGGPYALSAGGVDTTITPASNSLQSLVTAINNQAGQSVQASIVNVGSTSSPDYRLSLTAVNLGSGTIDLQDSTATDLIANSTAGSPAAYTIDGSSTPIYSTSRSITLAPGLTVSLVGQSISGEPTTITVFNDPTALASAFTSFAAAYNSAADALSQYHGQNGGVLEGDSLIQDLSNVLGQLGTYGNGSPSTALANYGVTLDQTGQLSVDTNAFTTAANANFSGLLSALGGTDTGGFLQTASNLLNGVNDPVSGEIAANEKQLTAQIADQNNKIGDEQAKIAQLQTNLNKQISDADATIASLESQVSYVTGLFAQYTGAYNTQANGLQTL